MKHFTKLFSRAALAAVLAVLTAGMAWGAVNDVHDMNITQSTVLNNNAAIPSIEIPAQSYPVKKITINWRYNKATADVVTIAVSVNGTSWGTEKVGTNTTADAIFEGEAATGPIVISFTNHAGEGTGKGTFYVNSVKLTEGSTTPVTTYNVSFNAGAGTFVGNTDFPNTSNSVEAGTYTLPSATPAFGYTFDGWTATGISTPITGSYTVSGDIDFTAHYSQTQSNTHTYSFAGANNFYTDSNLTTHPSSGSDNNVGTIYYGDGSVFVADGTNRYFSSASSGYFMLGKTGATITLPTFEGYKITQVKVHSSTAHSTSVAVSIVSGNNTASAAQTWSTKDKDYVYNIASAFQSSSLAVKVTNSYNSQFTSITIVCEEDVTANDPSITAADVSIAYDATSGNIAYTIGNEPSPAGTLTASVPAGSWITPGTATGSAVPFTCTANEANTARTETVTLTYTYGDNQTVTKDVTVTQAEAPVIYDDIADLFAAATGTATSVNVSFESWFVTGVSTNGKNVFVSDGTNGFVIFDTNGGLNNSFEAGDMLSSEGEPVVCNLVLYNGFAEITGLNVSDLHITKNQYEEYLAPIAMAQLAGVNTGAVVHYENLTCSVSNSKYYLSDGTTTLQVYNALYAFNSLEAGKQYNITGVYQQYNNTKEILPRSADDITEVTSAEPSIIVTPTTINVTAAGGDGTITVTYNNITDVAAEVLICDANGNNATYDWFEAEINGDNNVEYVIGENTGSEARTAYLKVWAYDDDLEEVYSDLITITQAGFVVDYATLPFTWAGGGKNDLLALTGVTAYGLGSDYAASNNAPYLVKFDGTGDYIQVKTDSQPGVVTVGVKMFGSDASTITVQESVNGVTFTDVQALTISGSQSDILTLETTNDFAAASRFVRLLFNKGSNVGVGPISITKYSSEPVITVSPDSVEATAEENEGTLDLAYRNLTISDMEDFAVQFYNADEKVAEEPDWIEVLVAEQDPAVGTGYVVSYYMLANEDAAARTVYFKVYALGDEDYVYSNLVTISQAAPVFAELPFEYNGNGLEEQLPDGLSQEGLTGQYNVDYTKMKFDDTGDYLLLKFNEAPGILTFDIKGNGFSGGTFKVQTSTNGTTFTDLVTYTELAGTTATETFASLPTNVRYIKWVYTEKVGGNVGLGNISLTAFNPAAETINLSATLNKGGYWATFFNGSASYMLPEGAQAFTMNSSKELYRLGENGRAIPAGTAVVIVSDTGSITLTKDETIQSVTVNGGTNILSGYNVDTAKPATGKVYVLGIVNGTLGFYELQKSKIPAMKAYYVIENVGE